MPVSYTFQALCINYFLEYPCNMGVKSIFGNNLHSYRKLKGFSQEQLAEKLNISTKHLSTLETGKVFASAELIEKLSQVLNVSISSLFYTPEEKSYDESDFCKISQILEDEFDKSLVTIKEKIKSVKK